VGILGILLATPSGAQPQVNEEIYGTWRLLSWTRHVVGAEESTDALGTAPRGFLSYGRDGRMLAMIVKANRPKSTDPANETWTGTAQVRNFRIEGRRLTISVDPQVGFDGREATAVLQWEKVQ
jgi:hypothetical protein